MPLRRDGGLRKRWRYVGFYGEGLMLCAARAEVGPTGQCFWALWDRERGQELAHTSLRPGSREVLLDGPRLADRRPRASTPICASARPPRSNRSARAGRAGAGPASGPGSRSSARSRSRDGGSRVDGLGVDDESAGYQARHTSWHWSAGVGTAGDGRALAWNLVEGINDPPEHSERAVWVDGVPHEPAPVAFDGLDAVRFAGGSRLDFTGGAERSRDDNFLLIRSTYRHRFGTFAGSLDGIDLAEGCGVMESHTALW